MKARMGAVRALSLGAAAALVTTGLAAGTGAAATPSAGVADRTLPDRDDPARRAGPPIAAIPKGHMHHRSAHPLRRGFPLISLTRPLALPRPRRATLRAHRQAWVHGVRALAAVDVFQWFEI